MVKDSQNKGDKKITATALQFLISQGEGYNVEFKEKLNTASGKEICAFANASGGKLLVGVDDSGKEKGFSLTNKIKSTIQDIVRSIDPKISVKIYSIGKIVVIDIPEGKEKPYSISGKFYLRQGANTQKLERNEIRNFFQKEGIVLFDKQLNDKFNIKKDIDKKTFNNFLQLLRIRKTLSTKQILENLNILEGDAIKNVGVLLFTKNIEKFFLQATITCVLFQGKTKYKILDRKEFSEVLYSNYVNAFNYIKAKLNTEFIIKGGPREEKLELPEEALREAILNAIAHRNYFMTANIQIYIFSDRVEIVNPGGLTNGLTLQDLGKKSLPRNNLLFSLMQRMDLVEKIGSGILRIRNAMRKYNLSAPKIEADENWFTIIFKRNSSERGVEKVGKKVGEKVGENQLKILDLISKNNRITYSELSKKINISEKNIYMNIEKLKQKKLLKRIGPAKGGHWEIITK